MQAGTRDDEDRFDWRTARHRVPRLWSHCLPDHDFAGTNESTSATLLRCEIEMFRGFDCVQLIPSRSQYSQNSARMSADRFEKNHRGYAYSPTRPLGSRVERVNEQRFRLRPA